MLLETGQRCQVPWCMRSKASDQQVGCWGLFPIKGLLNMQNIIRFRKTITGHRHGLFQSDLTQALEPKDCDVQQTESTKQAQQQTFVQDQTRTA